jgi:hypothetical protein
MILRYEKEVHISHSDDAVPGGGNDDFVLLTLSRIHKQLSVAIAEVHEVNSVKMGQVETTLKAIGEKVGAEIPQLAEKKAAMGTAEGTVWGCLARYCLFGV